MGKWFVAAKKADFNQWSEEFHIHPVTARVIRNRNIVSREEVRKYLYGDMQDLYDPMKLLGMSQAVDIIIEKIRQNRVIRIIGDYDVDGICAAHILTKGLRTIGARVDTAIPHRIRDGYGLSEQLVTDAYEAGVDTIITCDNGIAAAPQITYAKQLGMTVVVTDHHEVPFMEKEGLRKEILPPADAVVDPKQEASTYPFSGICGGMVAFKVLQAVYMHLQPVTAAMDQVMDEMVQFAALATVCDVMELLDENRIIVKEGLKRMRKNASPGLQALMAVNGIDPGRVNVYHLGFVIGPCMNATGRLDTALRAMELLAAPEGKDAILIAEELKELNESRKIMTQSGVEQAAALVESQGPDLDKVQVLFLPDCHESLAGIIAGRIREEYGRPTLVLTRGEEGIKGSGRSIEEYHMHQALTACSGLLIKFGGHRMAAGLSMEEKDIPALREQLNRLCTLTEDDFIPKVHIDAAMPLAFADKEMARDLEVLEPYGISNPKPLFARKEVHLRSAVRLGEKGNFTRFILWDETPEFREAVYFGDPADYMEVIDGVYGKGAAEKLFSGRCDYVIAVTYQLTMNYYRGREEAQIILQHFAESS